MDEPGPALDARVATEVMGLAPCNGWHRFNMGSAGGPAISQTRQLDDGTIWPEWGTVVCPHKAGECFWTKWVEDPDRPFGWRYSTSIADAWVLIEHLWLRGFVTTVQIVCGKFSTVYMGNQADVEAKLNDTGASDINVAALVIKSAPTAPYAICLAALRAVATAEPAT